MFRILATSTALTLAGGTALFAEAHSMAHGDDTLTIVENAQATEDLSTLVAAVVAGDLVETLSGEGPFTVFAPTNEAFAALPEGTLDTLLMAENKDQLTGILTCHAVSGDVTAETLVGLINDNNGSYTVETLGGCELTAALDGETVTLTDQNGAVATVVMADVAASNGTVHVIDAVVTPAM